MRLLILGGTSEARAIANVIAKDNRFAAVLSLAGRTSQPLEQPVACRIGGFGGVDGLVDWLRRERIDAIIDATHPFADQISRNAVEAAAVCNVPLASFVRVPWDPKPGDKWIEVANVGSCVAALGGTMRRVFLTVGRVELSQFAAAPQHTYLARTIDPPGDISLPPNISFVFGRGPFDLESEAKLMRDHRIEVVVSKNSGGASTYSKIEAARALGLDVIMISQPEKHVGERLMSVDQTMKWLETCFHHHANSVSDRGV